MGIEDKMVAWGEYPAGYNAKVHGPYDPARFYGKADTALADVKLAELPSWLMRRQIGLSPAAGAVSRAFWRWQHKYVQPKGWHCTISSDCCWFYDHLLLL